MARQALGKGLDALLKQTQEISNLPTEQAAQAVQHLPEMSVQKIDIKKIVPNRFQPRRVFDEEKLQELAASIKEHGLTQPIVVVYDASLDKYEIVVGERRFRATQLAGLTEIDAIIHKHLNDQQLCALALIENIQREDLNPIETAMGYRSLMQKFYVKQVDLAAYCGKSKAAISNTLRLLELEPEVQQALQDGVISEGHARALLMLPAGPFRVDVFSRIARMKMSVRQTEQMVARLNAEAVRARERNAHPEKYQSPDVVAFEQSLQEALGTKVEVKFGRNPQKGTLVIHYHSLEELDNIAGRLKNKML